MRTASSTSTDTRREQPGSVMVTPSSCEASSIVALLCVMKMNCTRSDICLHDVAEAADVVLVERRVDFVEQAERRGIEIEDREHQRDRGQRLLAARELVNAAVALARRARHDGDAGRQHVFADQLQVRVAAAEQLREFVLEAVVDAVERVLEARARFLVDLAHRLFERGQRRGDVGVLAVEVFLALARFLELVDGREIHLPEFLEIGARARQRFFPGRHRGIGREPREDFREFEARGRELLDDAFAAYARFLRDETRLLHAGTRGVDARFGIEPLLVERAQRAVGFFERAALGARVPFRYPVGARGNP